MLESPWHMHGVYPLSTSLAYIFYVEDRWWKGVSKMDPRYNIDYIVRHEFILNHCNGKIIRMTALLVTGDILSDKQGSRPDDSFHFCDYNMTSDGVTMVISIMHQKSCFWLRIMHTNMKKKVRKFCLLKFPEMLNMSWSHFEDLYSLYESII